MASSLCKDNFFAQWCENKLFFEWKIKESEMIDSFAASGYYSPKFAAGSCLKINGYADRFSIHLNNFSLDYARSMKLTIHDSNDLCKHLDNKKIINDWNITYKQKDTKIPLCVHLNLNLFKEFPIIVRCAINCVDAFSQRWNENSSNCSISTEKASILKEPASDCKTCANLTKPAISTTVHVAPKCLLQLSTDFKKLFDQTIKTDIVLNAGNHSIKAHKLVLQARSPVFLKMFDHSTSEISGNVVNIPDISPEAMKKFVGYLYSGTMEECRFEETLEMYYAADKYEVLSLREDCVPELLKNLHVNSACSLFALASRHSDEDLKEKIVQFASEHFESIIETKSFEELSQDDIKTFTRLCTRAKKK